MATDDLLTAAPAYDLLGARTPDAEAALLRTMREQFRQAEEAESAYRREALDDLRFRGGEQWAPYGNALEKQRRIAMGRPCLTVNTLPQYERQVTNEARQNKPSIRVLPVGNGADVKTAKTLQGLCRHIEQASHADVAYQTAFEAAVRHGRGYFRLCLEYEDPMSFEQHICIARIRNPFMVYMDPGAQLPTYADANWGFTCEQMPREVFQEQWGVDGQSMQFWSSQGDSWIARDQVRLAEYFWRDTQRMTLAQLVDGQTVLLEPTLLAPMEELENPEPLQRFVAHLLTPRPRYVPLLPWLRQQAHTVEAWLDGLPVDFVASYGALLRSLVQQVRQVRPTTRDTIRWVKTNGHVILEESIWPGKWIPIIPVLGEELDINNQVMLSGVIRHAKDPMRMENYWLPLAIDTPIPTPEGWTTMGEVQPGAQVFDDQGMPCTVMGKSPIHTDRVCYRVHFDDGSSLVADAEHPWRVEERGKRIAAGFAYTMRTVPTQALQPAVHSIVRARPLDLPKQELPIDPYVLGVWLGDGTAHCPEINIGTKDIAPLRETLEHCGAALGEVRRGGEGCWKFTLLGLRPQFVRLGLLDNKHIPAQYLRASYEQRLALLQGLMDTDGTINRMGQCDLTTALPALRDGIAELLRTLGLRAFWYPRHRKPQVFPNGKTYQSAKSYQFGFSLPEGVSVFRLPRKAVRQWRTRPYHPRRLQRHRIMAIELVPSVPVCCLAVSSDSHLFLAGSSMVPTHNTMQAEHVALSPVPPWLVAAGQVEDFEEEWKSANRTPRAYLPYNPLDLNGHAVPPPTRNQFEPPIQAITLAMQTTQQYSEATMGIYRGNVGAPSKERSGRAIAEKDQQTDTGLYHYADNLARAIQFTGEQMIDLIPKILTPGRVQRILGDDGSPQQVLITQEGQVDGQPVQEDLLPEGIAGVFDLATGTYDVIAELGPSYATKREEAASQMLELTRALPDVMRLAIDKLVGTMDWEGASEIAERLRKTLPPELLDEGTRGQPKPEQQLQQLQAALQQLQQQLEALNAYASEAEQAKTALEQQNAHLTEQLASKRAGLVLDQAELAEERRAEQAKLALEAAKLDWEKEKFYLTFTREGARRDAPALEQ